MPKIILVRVMTHAERETIDRLSRSRTASAREVERAHIIQWASKGQGVPSIAAKLNRSENTVRTWIKRFNERGLAGLQDEQRRGRPATYSAEDVSAVIQAALTKPDEVGLAFGHWTLDRLETYLHEEKGIAIKRSRINELLLAEGLRWRKDEHWFGERVDPAFAQKRGGLLRSTPSLQRAVSS